MSDQGAPPSGEESTTPEVTTEETKATEESGYQQKLEQRLEELSKQNQTIADQFQEWRESQTVEDDDGDDEELLEEGDDGYEEQAARQYLEKLAEEVAEKKLAPMRLQQANSARDQAFEKLTRDYTDLQDPDVAKKYVDVAVQWLDDLNPDAIEDHRLVALIEKLYKADKADERAAQETPPQRTASLEHGGGAAPAGQEESMEERLMKQLKDAPAL